MLQNGVTIPTYKLYGEDKAWPTPELLHHESIAERSVIHGWVIRPHRHHDLFQILYIRKGGAHINVDGLETAAHPPSIITLPPMSVHGFRFTEDIDGHVITLPDFAFRKFLAAEIQIRNDFAIPHILESISREQIAALDHCFVNLAREFASDNPARLLALEANLSLILVVIARQIAVRNEKEHNIGGKGTRHLRRFHELIEQSFRKWLPVEGYASALDITSTQLNNVCRMQTGKSALQLIHERIVLEAKRNLIYTVMTVSEVAFSLGFNDPAYFSRFFTKNTGQSPSGFRKKRMS